MNKILSFASLFLSLFLTILSCSDGGSRRIDPAGACREGYDPIQMEVAGAQKLSLELSDQQIPPGIYTYAGAEVYILDKREEKELVIHVREQKIEGRETFQGSGLCVRGFRAGLSVAYEVSGVSAMTVDAENKADISTRNFPVTFDANGRTLDFEDGTDLKNESPSKVFLGKPTTQSEFALFKISDTSFEIRSVDQYENGLKIKLITKLTRTNLAPAPVVVPVEESKPSPPTPAPTE